MHFTSSRKAQWCLYVGHAGPSKAPQGWIGHWNQCQRPCSGWFLEVVKQLRNWAKCGKNISVFYFEWTGRTLVRTCHNNIFRRQQLVPRVFLVQELHSYGGKPQCETGRVAVVLLIFEIGHSRNHSITEGAAVMILVYLILTENSWYNWQTGGFVETYVRIHYEVDFIVYYGGLWGT